MSFRGRGRGRYGGGGSSFSYARQEPFVEFPELELPDRNNVKEERFLAAWNYRFLHFWKSSPYYLEDTVSKEQQSTDIERYSDRGKPKASSQRDSLDSFLQYGSDNFPKELIRGSRRESKKPKSVQWNPNAGLQKLDLFEKLEQKYKGQEEKGEKEKKEGEEEEEEENEEIEEVEGDFSDDDYYQNQDFDDDEDDFNVEDDNGGMHLPSNELLPETFLNCISPVSDGNDLYPLYIRF